MATFVIETNDNFAYNKIMDFVRTRSLTFCKNINSSGVTLELIGTVSDFNFFETLTDEINVAKGEQVVFLNEAY